MTPDFYFDTRFKDIATATDFPARFGIITAYATTVKYNDYIEQHTPAT